MTVSTAYAPLEYAGNGASTAFPVTWPFFSGTLVVTLVSSAGVETVKTITTHYTVSGGTASNGLPATGAVTMLTAPASGETLRITRGTAKTQASSWADNDPFPAKTIEAALDKLTLLAQEGGGGGGAADGITGDVMQLDSSGAQDFWDGEGNPIRVPFVELSEGAAPSTPSSGYGRVYTKTDGYLYHKNDAGTETDLTGAATNAATSAAAAATSASGASTSATNAAASATLAAASAASAASSATNAASSATAAAASYDSFDDRYLGAKSSDPLVDNDGAALITGALYFNSVSGVMRDYNGSAWANVGAASVTAAAASAAAAAASATAAGFKWAYDTTTAMGDPGTGDIRLNNATLSSVTAIAISDLSADAGNPDVSAFVLGWDDSTNTALRGTLTIRKASAPQNYAQFSITGASTDNAGWTQLAVTYVGHSGSFSAADPLFVLFARTGNKGADGAGTGDMRAEYNLSDLANAGTARANLGVEIGTNVQAYSANLTSWSALAPAAKQDALGFTPANTAGDTFIGGMSFNTWALFLGQTYFRGAAGTYRCLSFDTNGVQRWFFGTDNSPESGANAGSDFSLFRYDDAGVYLGWAFSVNRATGVFNFNGAWPTVNGNQFVRTVNGSGPDGSGNVTVSSGVQDVRLGAQATLTASSSSDHPIASSGHVITKPCPVADYLGTPVYNGNGYERPIQKQVSGTWTTVSQV